MAWIESHQSLRLHPKTAALAEELDTSIATAIGHLHMLWWWAMDYACNGDVTRYSHNQVATACGYDGDQDIYTALITAGFIDSDGTIHNWGDYAGKLIEQREQRKQANRERQRLYRERNALVTRNVTQSNGPTVPNRTVPNQTKPKDSFEFDEFWNIYPRKAGKGGARKAFTKALGKESFDTILLGAQRYADDPNREDEFTAMASTWLNQERWEDDPLPTRKPKGGSWIDGEGPIGV